MFNPRLAISRGRRRVAVVAAVAVVLLTGTVAASAATNPGVGSLVVSKSADRSAPQALSRSNLNGNVYIFLSRQNVKQVAFSLDGKQVSVERISPFDLNTTAPDGSARPLDTSTLSGGSHRVVAVVTTTSDRTRTYSARFTVGSSTSGSTSTTARPTTTVSSSTPTTVTPTTVTPTTPTTVTPTTVTPTTMRPTTTSTTTPAAGGFSALGRSFPSSATTGVPDGTALTNYTGECAIQTNNVVIDAKIVNCDLRILAQGIKISRSIINGSVYSDPDYFNGSFTITDSEVRMPLQNGTGIGDANFTVTRVEVTGGSRSINCYLNCTVQDSYVHGQYKDTRGIDHESGIRMGSNSVLRHNTIACTAPDVPPDAGCSAAITGYGDFDIVQKNTIDGNLIVAGSGGYCAYGGSTQGKPYSAGVNNIKFTNNVWQRGTEPGENGRGYVCGYYGPITSFDSDAPGNVWTNNLYDDGTPVEAAN